MKAFPRLTVRRLMVLVLVSGLILGYWITLIRYREYRSRADAMARAAQQFLDMKSQSEIVRQSETKNPDHDPQLLEKIDRDIESSRRWHEHWHAMAIKYDRAARYPWLPVEPDPPAPY